MDFSKKEKKLNFLNDIFIKEEEKLFNTIKKVKQFAEQLLKDREISDYYFSLQVQGYKTIDDEDSFFKSNTNMLLAQLIDHDKYEIKDYTETMLILFNGMKWNNPHCIAFHDLCCHSDLKIEEILEIWLEVKTNCQFITKF